MVSVKVTTRLFEYRDVRTTTSSWDVIIPLLEVVMTTADLVRGHRPSTSSI
jgi:hypothetical protein